MIVWGGSVSGTQVNDGKSYDPSADAWSTISMLSAPSPREAHSAIWTGSRMIVWGGMFINHIPTPPVTFYLNTGGSYDPAGNSWTPLPTLNAPAQRLEPLAVWTGTRMIVWGGDSGTVSAFASGGRFDPASNSWTPTATTRRPPRTHGAWTGALWILWNGSTADPGARYDPLTDSWSDISNVGAPPPRTEHIPLWTGSRMLVWGGSSDPQLVQGGRYDPVSNSWSPMATIGAPYGRINHTAVWTGSQMLIWGGEYLVSSSDFAIADDGRKYDPVADTWSPIPTTGSPSARYGHVAVWTGTRMVVWGGTGSSPGLVSGGIFNPATDSWSSTSLSGVPEPRRFATAVWTGSRMVVWGGYNQDTFSFVDSGGLFDPDTNAWTSTALHNAPSPRIDHSAVWTGTRMIIFGGQGIGPVSRDGSRFDPVSNSWAAISLVGGPPAMYRHAAAWTGGSMLIYQGSERGGGQYFLDQAVDNDGDGFSECSGDCRDQDPAVHPGAVELCDGVDNDCNGLIDDGPDADGDGFTACNGDCNDADPGAWAYPPEVMNVQPDGTSVSVWVWDAQSQLVGPGVLYEVASGPIGPGGAQLTAGACLGTVSSAQFTDAQPDPALGWGTWFLVRSKNSCQEGSYGTDSLGGERLIPSCP